MFSGDYKTLAAVIGFDAAKRLSTKLLIDPKAQNIMERIIIAAKNNSPQQAAILAQELIKTHSSPTKEKEEQRQQPVK